VSDSDDESHVQLYGWVSRRPDPVPPVDKLDDFLARVPVEKLRRALVAQGVPEPDPAPSKGRPRRTPVSSASRASGEPPANPQPRSVPFNFGTGHFFFSSTSPEKTFFHLDFRDSQLEQFIGKASNPGVPSTRLNRPETCDSFMMNAVLGNEFDSHTFDTRLYSFKREGEFVGFVELCAGFVSVDRDSNASRRIVVYSRGNDQCFVNERIGKKSELKRRNDTCVQFTGRLTSVPDRL
jgi:hypothetical protein